MKAIRALLIGQDAKDVAQIFDIAERTLNRWIHQFNDQGIDGLLDNPRCGRPRALAVGNTSKYRELVDNPAAAGETHWTARKFHGYLTTQMMEEVAYRTTVRWLHEQNYALRVPRPWPDRQNEEERKQHITLLTYLLANPDAELWYGDESGFEGDPRPRRRWVQRGSRPTRIKNGDHIRENAMGIICPRTGEFFAMGFTSCDLDCFQAFLDEANKALAFTRKQNFLILDNASWHKCASIKWGNFAPLYLPAYSPDLNPIERLWLLLKETWFCDYFARDRGQLIERVDQSLTWAMDNPARVQTMCTIKTKL
jgi:transposase